MTGQTCTQKQAMEVGAIRKPRQVVSLDDICQLQAQYTELCEGQESSSISGLGRRETLGVTKRKQEIWEKRWSCRCENRLVDASGFRDRPQYGL